MADAVNTYQEEPAESQEHVDAMLAKVEGTQVDPERPEWLPEKFKSPEEMAKAYSSLESKLGQSSSEETTSEPEEAELEEVTNQSASEVSDLLDSRGLDFDVFQEEYMQTGTLSPEAYQALEEAGLSETLVDTWIEGQNALANQVTSQMQSLVGGAEEYGQLVQWASDNLPEGEVDAYNQVMETQDPDLIRLAVQGLNARYRSEAEPSLLQGGTGEVTGGKFSSNAELTAAMRDPRYAQDPAYRQQVADKLARSSLF
jgi:hypothetical protein